MIKLNYNEPVKVPKDVYYKMMIEFEEIIAGLEKKGKYYIKLWDMKYKTVAEKRLNQLIK